MNLAEAPSRISEYSLCPSCHRYLAEGRSLHGGRTHSHTHTHTHTHIHICTQVMCIRAVNTYSFVFDSVLDRYKTQEICISTADDNIFTLKYIPDRYKTKEVRDIVVDDNPKALEFVPD